MACGGLRDFLALGRRVSTSPLGPPTTIWDWLMLGLFGSGGHLLGVMDLGWCLGAD